MRLKYIDALKGFGMVFIMWGHIINFYENLSWWASPFKIVIFYTVSGYLLSLRSRDGGITPKTPFKKLLVSLGIPYVFYSLLSLIMASAVFFAGEESTEFLIGKVVSTLTLSGISTLWFLPSMFIGRGLFDSVYNRNKIKWLKAVFLVLTPFILCAVSLNYKEFTVNTEEFNLIASIVLVLLKGITALWFIAIGFESGRISKKISSTYRTIVSFAFVIIASVVTFFNRGIDLNFGDFGVRPMLFFLTASLYGIGLIGVFRVLGEKLTFPVLSFIGKNSLFIMATHNPLYIVPVVSLIIDKFIVCSSQGTYYLRNIVIFALVLLIEWILILLKNKTVGFIESRIPDNKIKTALKYI